MTQTIATVQTPTLFPSCSLKYREGSDSWLMQVADRAIGKIDRLPRWVIEDDSIDTNLPEAYEVQSVTDNYIIGYAATLQMAVGCLLAHEFDKSIGIALQPSKRSTLPDYF